MISVEISDLQSFNETGGIIDLSLKNVRLAETVFSIYYKNSKLPKAFENLKDKYDQETLERVCSVINGENGTHLRNYEKTIIVNEILRTCSDIYSFKDKLKDEEYSLVGEIVALEGRDAYEEIEGYKSKNKEHIVRKNYSFATKLCHYACYYLFKDDKDRDRYPIYDSVLVEYVTNSEEYRQALDNDLSVYKNYVSIVDEIIKGKGISRNGFDHLIWLSTRTTI